MQTMKNGRVRRSTKEWESLLSRHEQSGRGRAAFCRAEGISRSSFDLWHRKLRSSKSPQPTPAKQFLEITSGSSTDSSGWTFEIELPDGSIARLRG